MQKVDLPTSFTKLNENCGLPDIFTDYQIRHLGNPSGLPENLLKIDPWSALEKLEPLKAVTAPRYHLYVHLAPVRMLLTFYKSQKHVKSTWQSQKNASNWGILRWPVCCGWAQSWVQLRNCNWNWLCKNCVIVIESGFPHIAVIVI